MMGHMHGLGYTNTAFALILVGSIAAILSLLASSLTIFLIHAVGRWNGYMRLIYAMTLCQIIYDLNFFLLPGNDIALMSFMNVFLSTFGGLSVTFFTNVLSVIVVYVVKNQRLGKNLTHFWTCAGVCIIPSLAYGLACAVIDLKSESESTTASDHMKITAFIYNVARMASISFNALACAWVLIVLNRKGSRGKGDTSLQPVFAMVSRLIFYPVCQIVTRLPASAYDFIYLTPTNPNIVNSASTAQIVALFFYAIFTPAAGIGYFIVFLIMQPLARRKLQSILFRDVQFHPSSATNSKSTTSQEYLENGRPGSPSKMSSLGSEAEAGARVGSMTDFRSFSRNSSVADDKRRDSNYRPSDGRLSDIHTMDEDELCDQMQDNYARLNRALQAHSKGELEVVGVYGIHVDALGRMEPVASVDGVYSPPWSCGSILEYREASMDHAACQPNNIPL